jgi:hypothetical protein
MRNLEAEKRILLRLTQAVGALFLLGLIAIAIGTEIMILDMWATNPAGFWIWQGAWAVAHAFVVSSIIGLIKSGSSKP